jgi:hypothetical protein
MRQAERLAAVSHSMSGKVGTEDATEQSIA